MRDRAVLVFGPVLALTQSSGFNQDAFGYPVFGSFMGELGSTPQIWSKQGRDTDQLLQHMRMAYVHQHCWGCHFDLLCQCFEIARQLLSCCVILVIDLAEELLWSRKKSCISFVACTINWKCCFRNYSQRKNAKKLVSTQILQIRIRENLRFICNGKAGVFWWVLKMAIRQSNPDLD